MVCNAGPSMRLLSLLFSTLTHTHTNSHIVRIQGTIEIEMEDGNIMQVDAQKYVNTLKAEAEMLKQRLGRGPTTKQPQQQGAASSQGGTENDEAARFNQYIASRQNDMKSLTKGMSPDILRTMKQLVDYVLDDKTPGKKNAKDSEEDLDDDGPPPRLRNHYAEMELPGAALQQLALWQMVLGYKLREEEAKGDYLINTVR